VSAVAGVLSARAARVGIAIPAELARRLTVYYELLSHWNRTINLTSLSDPDEAVDRLLLEPIAAAAHVPNGVELIDIGSGGGSPALPLALAVSAPSLVMVESRARKAAFLREALRELGMTGAVETARFEDVAADARYQGRFALASVRAVRLDQVAFSTLTALLRPGGIAALFRTVGSDDPPSRLPATLRWLSSRELIPASRSALTLLERSTWNTGGIQL
jgi:16S rRNA (guanine527-N7)-methyltransferase